MRRYLRILPAFIYARLVRRCGEKMFIGGYGYFYDGHGILVPSLTKSDPK